MKKKIITLALVVCLITLSIAGATTAYFTDTKSVTNTFVSGSNDIKINLTMTNATTNEKLFPGVAYNKTTVLSNTGADSVYVGVIISLSNTGKVVTAANALGLIEGINTDYQYAVVSTDTGADIYLVRKTALPANSGDTVFTNFVPDASWDNDTMEKCGNMTLTVSAYATQTAGMTGTALDALKAAFSNAFASTLTVNDLPTTNP